MYFSTDFKKNYMLNYQVTSDLHDKKCENVMISSSWLAVTNSKAQQNGAQVWCNCKYSAFCPFWQNCTDKLVKLKKFI